MNILKTTESCTLKRMNFMVYELYLIFLKTSKKMQDRYKKEFGGHPEQSAQFCVTCEALKNPKAHDWSLSSSFVHLSGTGFPG